MTPLFDQFEALLCIGTTVYFADDRALRAMDRLGAITTFAEDRGGRMYGLAAGPNGPIAAVYDTGEVIEVQSRRVLATSEPPWRPVDVAMHDGALYVAELAQYRCCFKGPRVRRIRGGESTTLLTRDDGSHVHLVRWLPAALGVAAVATVAAIFRDAREETARRLTYTSQYDQNEPQKRARTLGTSGRQGAVQRSRSQGENGRATTHHGVWP